MAYGVRGSVIGGLLFEENRDREDLFKGRGFELRSISDPPAEPAIIFLLRRKIISESLSICDRCICQMHLSDASVRCICQMHLLDASVR